MNSVKGGKKRIFVKLMAFSFSCFFFFHNALQIFTEQPIRKNKVSFSLWGKLKLIEKVREKIFAEKHRKSHFAVRIWEAVSQRLEFYNFFIQFCNTKKKKRSVNIQQMDFVVFVWKSSRTEEMRMDLGQRSIL